MRRLRYYIRLWNGYQRISLLMVTQYPADTVIWILSMLLREASAFLGVVTIANVAGGFGRWNLYELCLLFSMCAIIEAIGQSFFDNIWGINYHVDVYKRQLQNPRRSACEDCGFRQIMKDMFVSLAVDVSREKLHIETNNHIKKE